MDLDKKNGYVQIYLDLLRQVQSFDLSINAEKLGLSVNDDLSVIVNFLNRKYLVNNEGVWPLDERPVGVNHLSLVLHYAMSPGQGEPTGEFLPLSKLASVIDGPRSYERDAVNTPLLNKFKNLNDLENAIAAIGGIKRENDPSGALAWLIKAFPKIILKLTYHQACDEFPAEYRLFFDAISTDYVEFEALGFLTGIFVRELCEN